MNFTSNATVPNFKKDEKEVNQTERRAGMQKLGTFRSDYDYEYEYEFFNV